MSTSITSTDTKLQRAALRSLLKGFTRLAREHKVHDRYFVTACHQALNALCGKPNSHKLRKKGKYIPPDIDAVAERIAKEVPLPTSEPLRMYVTVNPHWHAYIPKDKVETKETAEQRLTARAAVQAVHAVAQATHAFRDHPRMKQWVTKDRTLVICSANSWMVQRNSFPVPAVAFWDEDCHTSNLAYAYLPMTEAEAEECGLKKLPLL